MINLQTYTGLSSNLQESVGLVAINNSQNGVQIPSSSYLDDPSNVGSAFGLSGAGALTARYALMSKRHQNRQNGNLVKIELPINNLTNVSAIHLELWRRDIAYTTGTWPHTYRTETGNLLHQFEQNLDNNITFALVQNIYVLEGDMLVLRLEASAQPCQPFLTVSGYANATIREYRSATAPTSPYNWSIQTPAYATTSIACKLYVNQKPKFAFWGDSLTSGYYDTEFSASGTVRHASYCGYDVFTRSVDIEDVSGSVPYKLGQLLDVPNYQNLGVNSQRTAQIDDRMPTDLLYLKPNLVLINAGRNDLSGGVGEATFLANYTTMLNAADAQNNNVLILSIYPATIDTDIQANTRRTWNASLETLVGTYDSNFHFLNVDEVVGVIRGSTGEYDDINPSYLGGITDGIHLNEDGNQALAEAIATYINSNNLLIV